MLCDLQKDMWLQFLYIKPLQKPNEEFAHSNYSTASVKLQLHHYSKKRVTLAEILTKTLFLLHIFTKHCTETEMDAEKRGEHNSQTEMVESKGEKHDFQTETEEGKIEKHYFKTKVDEAECEITSFKRKQKKHNMKETRFSNENGRDITWKALFEKKWKEKA